MRVEFENVVIISIDALRYDCLPHQKRKKTNNKLIKKFLKTPLLGNIEKNSVIFNNVFSTSVFTPPAHASLFTGLVPPAHKIREFYYPGQKLSRKIPTLAEYFSGKNYTTTAFSDFPELFQNLDLFRGFKNVFGDDYNFFSSIKNKKSKKNFLFLHFYDVHAPYLYSPSELYIDNEDYYNSINKIADENNVTLEGQFWKRRPYEAWNKLFHPGKKSWDKKILEPLYLKGITKFDQGRLKLYYNFLLKHFDMSKTVVILLSDHGEGNHLLENSNSFGHGPHLSEEVLRIPLIVHSPVISKKTNSNLLSMSDLRFLIERLANNISIEEIGSFKSQNSFAYAESFSFTSIQPLFSPQKYFDNYLTKRKKSAYHLYERVLIKNRSKLRLMYSPERLIREMDSFSLDRNSINVIMSDILRTSVWPKRLIRYLLYAINLIPFWGTRIALRVLIRGSGHQLVIYSQLNKYLEEDINIEKVSDLNTRQREKVLSLAEDIFKISSEKIHRSKISQFLDLL